MTTVQVIRDTAAAAYRNTNKPHRRMTIMSEGGKPVLTVPYAPQVVTHSDLVPGYTEIDRARGVPLLSRNQPKNRKQAFTLTFGSPGNQADQTAKINTLISIGRSAKRVKLAYGAFETGLWRISTITITSERRTIGGNIMQATVDVEFIMVAATPAGKAHGPASGGNKNSSGSKKTRPKFYVIRKGDTMRKIALRFYGKADMWKKIATVNKIKHPNNPKTGRKIKLP